MIVLEKNSGQPSEKAEFRLILSCIVWRTTQWFFRYRSLPLRLLQEHLKQPRYLVYNFNVNQNPQDGPSLPSTGIAEENSSYN